MIVEWNLHHRALKPSRIDWAQCSNQRPTVKRFFKRMVLAPATVRGGSTNKLQQIHWQADQLRETPWAPLWTVQVLVSARATVCLTLLEAQLTWPWRCDRFPIRKSPLVSNDMIWSDISISKLNEYYSSVSLQGKNEVCRFQERIPTDGASQAQGVLAPHGYRYNQLPNPCYEWLLPVILDTEAPKSQI